MRDIQVIETTSGTYIGEGYLMHNCYGNRMADHHRAKDVYPSGHPKEGQLTRRLTYTHMLGRDLSPNSGAALQWGGDYRDLYQKVLDEMVRVTAAGGLVVVNVSNHIRKHVEEPVVEWWLARMMFAGLALEAMIPVETQRMGFWKDHEARVDCEYVFVTRRPSA